MEDFAVYLQCLDTLSELLIKTVACLTSCAQKGIRYTTSYTGNQPHGDKKNDIRYSLPCYKQTEKPARKSSKQLYYILQTLIFHIFQISIKEMGEALPLNEGITGSYHGRCD